MKRSQWITLTCIMLAVLLAGGCNLGNVTLTVLQTSDVHNHASGYGPFLDYTPLNTDDDDTVKGGYARLAALINQIRQDQEARCIPTLVFDSGDFTMGTVYDMTVANPIALQYFSMAGYDAVTLGNHEFDWSSAGLAKMLYNGYINGLQVPVVATNMEIPAGNSLEALKTAGVIVESKVIEYPFGFKVGIIGLMGDDADDKAPVAAPVTFNHEYEYIQAKVDELRKNQHVQLVIALSHGGVKKDGTGEDADLAKNVKGIDVIASGHFHTATGKALTSGPSNTVIFSPGEYGEYLARLDLTYNVLLRKVVSHRFTLIPVKDTVKGDAAMQALVDGYNANLNTALTPLGVTLASPISKTSFPLELASLKECGFGNLAADSIRDMASQLAPLNDGRECDVSVVASGVIRDNLYPGRTGYITFSDIYNALPLGISPDTAQPLLGYPLMSLYVTAGDLRNICEAALTIAPVIGSDYYLNFSGIRVHYDPLYAEDYMGVQEVSLCATDDTFCTGEAEPLDLIDETTVYHCVVDLYALQMMGAVTSMGLQIIPRDKDGNPIPAAQYMNHRLDASPDAGIQELKEWTALMKFLVKKFPASGEGIPAYLYGEDGDALGRIY